MLVTGPHYSVLRIGDWKVWKDLVIGKCGRIMFTQWLGGTGDSTNVLLLLLLVVVVVVVVVIVVITFSSRVLPEKLTGSQLFM